MTQHYDETHRMKNSLIRDHADEVLAAFWQRFPRILPIDPMEIAVQLWHFYVELYDLHSKVGPDTDGALRYKKEMILVDKSLDPEKFPNKLGRYMFTIAHEIGHLKMHLPDRLLFESLPDLVDDGFEAALIRRSSCREEPERQADRFAGYLLMPQEFVTEVWQERHGKDSRPLNVYEELKEARERFHLPPNDRTVCCQEAKDFAVRFNVSPQAMQIQLSELGLIQLEEDLQGYLL